MARPTQTRRPFHGLAALAAALMLSVAPLAAGQSSWTSREEHIRQVRSAFESGDYAEAARLVEAYLSRWPQSPRMLYNAACAYAQLGDDQKAVDFLYRAVERGYNDFSHLERDPDLEPIRAHAVYARIIETKNEALARVAERQLRQAQSQFGGEGYRYEIDHDHRLTYAVALDEVSFRDMRAMLSRQADQMIESLFEAPPDYYVLVAVPQPGDATRIIRDTTIGGIYEHGRRRLVARDIGMMLRHEFTHVMHYGHMSRLNQTHALWVQEGISSLYESYEFDDNGVMRFLPNNRFNIIRRFVESNRAPAWSDMMTMPSETFMSRAGVTYPQVRSIFRWLAEQDLLATWYGAYVSTFNEDRSGRRAFEVVFNTTLEAVESDWKKWLLNQPYRDERIRAGDAALGIQIAAETINDGVMIDSIIQHGAAEAGGLAAGDVIVSIDDKPTRAAVELVEIIASHMVGDTVRVRYRRNGEYRTAAVTLRALDRLR